MISNISEKPLVSVIIPTHNRREKLKRLLKSLRESTYPKNKLEVIVINDASSEDYTKIEEEFPEIKIIVNKTDKLLAESRNIGIRHSNGDYVFIIDDDNVVDKECISTLVEFMESNRQVGVAGPIMYYYSDPKRVWCAGITRNMLTSKTHAIGRGEIDNGQFNTIESDSFPNAFMIRREIIINQNILFDSINFPIHYDEDDLCQKIKNNGWKVALVPKAKIWHDVPLKSVTFHIHNEIRAYYAGRNRIIFHKKYSKWWQFLFFILFFNWLFTLYYLKLILLDSDNISLKKKIELIKCYLRGVIDGLKDVRRCHS
jgi:hypothetical protein